MSDWQRDTTPQHVHPVGTPDLFALTSASAPSTRHTPGAPGPSCVTLDGADWLASSCAFPASVYALWRHRPTTPSILPCGTAFDVVSAPPLLGRRLLDRLWSTGPGSGPVAVHRGRLMLFAAPSTAQRLPALLNWGEWRELWEGRFPPLLCHGLGDTVTVPAPHPADRTGTAAAGPSRWLVAPDVRHPWLPGAEVLLRACVRSHRDRSTPRSRPSVRAGRGPATSELSIFTAADPDAKVYDVTRRR